MTIQIKIGAGAQVYDNIALANSMRGNQKISITGTGDEIREQLTLGNITNSIAANIGSIKATNDLNLTAAQVTTYKAALVKLGTKSIVLDSGTDNTAIAAGTLATNDSNFNNLDAVYTKIKSLTIIPNGGVTQPTITVDKLDTAVNLAGLEKLSGNVFNVSGNGTLIKDHMAALLKNISNIGTVTITGNTELQLTASQLSILGDKLVKSGTSTVVLKDTADNLLTSGSLALISRLNNSNINTSTTISTTNIIAGNGAAGTGIITPTGGHTLNTGDALTYTGVGVAAAAPLGQLSSGQTVYARKLSSTTIALYDTFAHAANLSSTTGLINSSALEAGTLVSQAGNPPTSSLVLDKIDVTKASLAQAARLGALGQINTTVISPGVNRNRLMPDIVRSVQIADTATNLQDSSHDVSVAVSSVQATAAASATSGAITFGAGNGFSTGDAVTYRVSTGGTAYSNLISGNTYYLGKIGASNQFVLYNSKDAALKADLSSQAAAYANASGGGVYIAVNDSGTPSAVGTHSFIASTLDRAMSSVGRLNNGNANVNRVTILGDGTETSTVLNDIATKVDRGYASAKATYSSKAVVIQNNLQAIYDNVHSTDPTVTKLDEIVVSDGTVNGKKGFSMSEAFYSALKTVFKNGIDTPATEAGLTTPQNKNYSFNVTGVAFNASTPDNYQNDVNVSGYTITGATYAAMDPVNTPANIVSVLGQSKLKSLSTEAITDSVKRAAITSVVNSIASPVDRAKMKILSA